MWLMGVYLVFMIIGDLADYIIVSQVERVWPEAGLPLFLALYFAFLWIAWIVAVRVTEPKPVASATP
jgi:hypothetical protein